MLALIEKAVRYNIPLVQIREKSLPAQLLFDLVARAAGLTHGSETSLLVNDRVDIAIAAGADGVHLPSHGFPVEKVRNIWPGEPLIGASVHSNEEIKRFADADLFVFGPVFSTPGKGEPTGLQGLERACEAAGETPVLALGGITEANSDSVLSSGAAGFAGISMLNDEKALERLSKRYYGSTGTEKNAG